MFISINDLEKLIHDAVKMLTLTMLILTSEFWKEFQLIEEAWSRVMLKHYIKYVMLMKPRL